MRVIKNVNSANACTLLGNKGADGLCAALDSLTKKDRKNIANYLVVPNNGVFSKCRSKYTFIFSHKHKGSEFGK